jgi:hypothetical protein
LQNDPKLTVSNFKKPKLPSKNQDHSESQNRVMPHLKVFKRLLLAIVVCSVSGCATLLDEETQEVQVRFLCAEKNIVATCNLQNSKGRWVISTPGRATILNDNTPLEITCKAPFIPSFTVSALPLPSTSMLGNLLAGGLIGIAVDVYNNTGMKYPENIDISNPNCK